jgi:DNA replication protein DnaC
MAEKDREARMKAGEPMKHIGEVLKHQQGAPPEQTPSTNGTSGEAGRGRLQVEKTTGDCECQSCGKTFAGEITTYNYPPDWTYKVKPGILAPRPPRVYHQPNCPECQEKINAAAETERQEKLAADRLATVAAWRRTCGIPEQLAARTFKNFESIRQPDAYQDAHEWAEHFDLENPKGYPSLIFYSDEPGLGKTHLMVSIANFLFDNWEGTPGRRRSPIYFVKGPQLVRRIRYTYGLHPEDYTHEREEDVYREITGVPLLLLDDVGKEAPSKFTRETYWYIIDERVTSGLPVIITSRLPLEGDEALEQLMGKDTVDRLYGMTRGTVTEMTGQSYRGEKGIP